MYSYLVRASMRTHAQLHKLVAEATHLVNCVTNTEVSLASCGIDVRLDLQIENNLSDSLAFARILGNKQHMHRMSPKNAIKLATRKEWSQKGELIIQQKKQQEHKSCIQVQADVANAAKRQRTKPSIAPPLVARA